MSDWNPETVRITESFVFFWKPPAVFGQWTRSQFDVQGVTYNCAEQFMMAEKARLFDDDEIWARIMASTDPAAQKRLGQAVRSFDEALWGERRMSIVVAGNLAKFTQSAGARREMLATGDRTLVEASPRDRIWGIGLRADHPDAEIPSRWQGSNLLGQALMEVRDQLRCGHS